MLVIVLGRKSGREPSGERDPSHSRPRLLPRIPRLQEGKNTKKRTRSEKKKRPKKKVLGKNKKNDMMAL